MSDILYYVDIDEELLLATPKALQHQLIIVDTHQSTLQCLGTFKTYDTLHKTYHWKGITCMVFDYLDACIPCQKRNLQAIKTPL